MRDVATRWTSSVAALAFAVALATTAPALAQTDLVPPSIVGQPPALDQPPLPSGVEEEARRVARRATPEALRARQESRTAHRNLSDPEALALAERLFPAATTKPTWTPPALAPGDELGPFEGDFARWVMHGPGKRPSIVDSEIPLRVEDESGAKREVSFALKESATAFEPENPHVPVRLPKRLSDGAALTGSDVAVVPDASAAPAPRTVGGKLFYPNADKDTDVILAPHPRGLETFHVLRADSAPGRLDLDFRLPAGAELLPAPGGLEDGARIVRAGSTLATVRAPEATDADGAPVPVRYELRGKRLSLEVDHREGDYRYPILVDPVVEDQNRWNTNSSLDFRGWRYYRNGTLFNAQSGRYGRGLYINRDPTYMQRGQYGEWYYQAPGDAFVYRAEYLDGHHDDQGSSCVTEYVSGGDGAEMCGGGHNLNRTFCTRDNCAVGGPAGNRMVFKFGFSADMQVTRNVGGFLGGARVYMHDTNAPSLDQPVAQVDPGTGAGITEPTGWTRQRSFATRFTGRDGGLGVKRHRVENPSGAIVGEKVYAGCTAQCPQVLTQTVPYTLPDGLHSLRARVRDNPDHPSAFSAAWERRVDGTAPTVTSTGTLKDSQADWLRDGAKRTLRIDARDESPSGPRAGVGSLKVEVDGKTVEPTSTCAQDSCRLVRDFSFDPAVYGDGRHTVAVTTTDRAGNVSAQTYAVKVDRGGPALKLSGTLKEAENTPVMEESYDLQAEATDPGAGVKSVEILVDGIRKRFDEQTCSAGSCPTSQTSSFTFNPAEYRRGEHVIEVKSIDGFDQATTETIRVTVQPRTGELPRYQFQRYKLGEGLEFAVNTGNGNGLLKQTDFRIEQTDLDFSLERYYNTLSDRDTATGTDGWSSNPGDVRLTSPSGRSAVLEGPSGYVATFVRREDGSFKSPPGFSEELTRASDGSYKLADPETVQAHEFDSEGKLTAKTEEADARTEYRYNDRGLLSSISDTEERTTSYEYNDKGALTQMTDSAGRKHVYERDLLSGNLKAYVAPTDERTEFGYDLRSGKLDSIKAPNGKLTKIGYDADNRVTSVTEDAGPLPGLGATTKYAYDTIGRTVATAADGSESVFRFDSSGMGIGSATGSGPPTLSLSGGLSDSRSTSLTDGDAYELFVDAEDSSGVRSVTAEIDGEAEDLTEQTCGDECAGHLKRFVLDTEDYNPGEYIVRMTVEDGSDDARSEALRVTVPPKPPLEDAPAEIPEEVPPASQPASVQSDSASPSMGTQPAVLSAQSGSLRLVNAASGAQSVVFGIAEEDPQAYADPLMFGEGDALNPTTVRRIVPYDLAFDPLGPDGKPIANSKREGFQAFYDINEATAEKPGRQMLVSFRNRFGVSDTDPGPSGKEYQRGILEFKKTWPQVKAYTPWNEPNTNSATGGRGGRLVKKAAHYTHIAQRDLCRGDCAIVAGGLAQTSGKGQKASFVTYLKNLRIELQRLNAKNRMPMPVYWAFHPYGDVERLTGPSKSGLHYFIKGAPVTAINGVRQQSKIWIDEVGAFFHYQSVSRPKQPPYRNTPGMQAAKTRHLIEVLAPLTRGGRVERVYYYNFCRRFQSRNQDFDTALLGPPADDTSGKCGPIRPAFDGRGQAVPTAFERVRDAIRGNPAASSLIPDP